MRPIALVHLVILLGAASILPRVATGSTLLRSRARREATTSDPFSNGNDTRLQGVRRRESLSLPGTSTAVDQETDPRKNDELGNLAETRIVGGRPVRPGKYPWFASTSGSFYCGATLIHTDILLTAAHCWEAFTQGAGMYIGAVNRGSLAGGAQFRTIVDTRFHPEYNDAEELYDFMLLKLDRPVTTITPIELNPNDNVPEDNDVLTTMGFGRTSEGGSPSEELLEVDVFAVNHNVCFRQYDSVTAIVEEVMLCAGVPTGGRDSCGGDSGGPLITADGKQVGVVSFGRGCARPEYSGVYGRISGAYDWIIENMCDLSDVPCPEEETGKIQVTIQYDDFPNQTTWELVQDGQVVYVGPQYDPQSNEIWTNTFDEFPSGNTTFTIYDSAGDGMAAGSPDGSFAIYHVLRDKRKILLAAGDSNFTFSQSVDFFVPGSDTLAPSAMPMASPTAQPTSQPTQSAAPSVSSAPSSMPSIPREPSAYPSTSPKPSTTPTVTFSSAPSEPPSVAPTNVPSASPTVTASFEPSSVPSGAPSEPTFLPTFTPTHLPSDSPSGVPSLETTPWPTVEPSAPPTVPATFAPTVLQTAKIQITVQYDLFANETTFDIFSQNGNVVYRGPEYEPNSYDLWTNNFNEFPVGEYTFTIYDSAGDGMSSGSQTGSFVINQVFQDKSTSLLAQGDDDFGFSQSVDFVVVQRQPIVLQGDD